MNMYFIGGKERAGSSYYFLKNREKFDKKTTMIVDVNIFLKRDKIKSRLINNLDSELMKKERMLLEDEIGVTGEVLAPYSKAYFAKDILEFGKKLMDNKISIVIFDVFHFYKDSYLKRVEVRFELHECIKKEIFRFLEENVVEKEVKVSLKEVYVCSRNFKDDYRIYSEVSNGESKSEFAFMEDGDIKRDSLF